MTSQNGQPGDPNNSNLGERAKAPSAETDHQRDVREMGLSHIDEVQERSEVPKRDPKGLR